MTNEEKEKLTRVFNLFLGWNLGDIRKAAHLLPNTFESISREKITKIYPEYDGGAMIGSLILIMTAIHSVAQFSLEHDGDKQFKWFIDTYLKKVNNGYDGEEIYALRCSLIKNYGLIARVYKQQKIVGFAVTDFGPDHLQITKNGKVLNIKQFMIELQFAIQNFFSDIILEKIDKKYLEKIIYYHDHELIGSVK